MYTTFFTWPTALQVVIEDIQKSIDTENDDEEEEEEGQSDTHPPGGAHTDPTMDYESVVIEYES